MKEKMRHEHGMLKERLEGFQVNPPESAWDNISSRLERRGRKRSLLIMISTAASLALAISLGLHFNQSMNLELAEVENIRQEPGEIEAKDIHTEKAMPVNKESLKEDVVALPRFKETKMEESGAPGMEKASLPFSGTTEYEEMALHPEEKTDHQPIPFPFSLSRSSAGRLLDRQSSGIHAPRSRRYAYHPDDPVNGLPEQGRMQDRVPDEEQAEAEKLLQEEAQSIYGENLSGDEGGKRPGKRWMLGAAFSPLYSYRDAEVQVVQSSGDQESGMLSYAGGVQVAYRTTRRLAVETGVYFNKMGINLGAPAIQLFAPDYNFAPMEDAFATGKVAAVSNSVGNIVTNSGEPFVNISKLGATATESFNSNDRNVTGTGDGAIRQHLDYIEFPLNLRYTILDRVIQLQLVGGVSTNFLVNNYVTMEGADGYEEIGYLSNVNTLNYSGTAGIGLVYHFAGRFSLNMEPRFRYYLNSVNDETLPATRPYSLGFYSGLSYFF